MQQPTDFYLSIFWILSQETTKLLESSGEFICIDSFHEKTSHGYKIQAQYVSLN